MVPSPVILDGRSLTVDAVVAVAREGARVRLSSPALKRMRTSRRVVEDLVRRNETAYGITTGFGEFAHIKISREKTRQLQRNLIMSHAVGVGEPFAPEVVRAAMLVRANALAKGFSGVQPAVVRLLVDMLNANVHPVVPSQGSLGASGDLAPLAHLVLPMIGLGEAELRGRILPGAEALRRARLQPIKLEAKDGLGLINGTAFMAGIGALLVYDARALLEDAQIAAAMTVEALLGTDQAFRPIVGELRPHPGHIAVAKNLWNLTRGSAIMASHKDPRSHAHSPRVQDAYSIRCAPQVLGASVDAVAYARRVIDIELNSATDNPLIIPGSGSLSAGNFHGQPLALALDFLAIALSEVANIAERRVDRLVNPHVSGMKAFLIESGGLNSGYMVAQYTAAALVSENKVLSHPASVDSIPTSANQEDHVSMGLTSATKAVRVLENAANVVAIEYMCAAQGLDFRRPVKPGKGSVAAHGKIRRVVPRLVRDRVLAPDIAKIRALMSKGALRSAVHEAGVRIAWL
ncbi:MAG TPA: histidine ammonia-lyase [Candidatus Thermoplasmatota archaeon]